MNRDPIERPPRQRAGEPAAASARTSAIGAPPSRNALVLAAVVLAALLPLSVTLRAAFVYDDTTIIRDNAMLRGWPALARVWSAPYWPSQGADVSGLYRPLHVAALALVWNVGRGAPLLFHLYAMALYALVAVLVWRLLRRATGETAAAIGALWFAVQPLHVEAVASVANSAELLVVAFTIALVFVFRRAAISRAAHRGHRLELLLAAVLAAAALASKESGLFAAPLAALTAWGWRGGETGASVDEPGASFRSGESWRLPRALAIACAVGVAVVLFARLAVLGAPVSRVSIAAPGLDVLTPSQRIAAMLSLWPRISAMLIWPSGLSPYYGPTVLPHQRGALAAVAVLVFSAVAAACVVLARRGDRRWLVALGWVVLTYLPASNLIAATGQLLADRTLFGATVGVAMAIAALCDGMPRRTRTIALLVSAIVIASGVVESARYAVAWSSHRTLWARLVETSPAEYRGYQLLGIDARERGDTTHAIPLLARAFAMEPRDRRTRFEYGQALYITHRYAQAAQLLAPLLRDGDVRREPTFVAMYLDAVGRSRGADGVIAAGAPLLHGEAATTAAVYVGAAAEQLGRTAMADSVYELALRTHPRDSLLLARRGALHARRTP